MVGYTHGQGPKITSEVRADRQSLYLVVLTEPLRRPIVDHTLTSLNVCSSVHAYFINYPEIKQCWLRFF
jgi:hypothetical protein